MALRVPGTPCSICGTPLRADDVVVMHPHVLRSDHPLWRFSDSCMHRVCYEQWEHHDYFEAVLRKAHEISQNRPVHLQRSWDEVKQLPPDERKGISDEIDSWSRTWRGSAIRKRLAEKFWRKDGTIRGVAPIRQKPPNVHVLPISTGDATTLGRG
jgi:hypothetical protein